FSRKVTPRSRYEHHRNVRPKVANQYTPQLLSLEPFLILQVCWFAVLVSARQAMRGLRQTAPITPHKERRACSAAPADGAGAVLAPYRVLESAARSRYAKRLQASRNSQSNPGSLRSNIHSQRFRS